MARALKCAPWHEERIAVCSHDEDMIARIGDEPHFAPRDFTLQRADLGRNSIRGHRESSFGGLATDEQPDWHEGERTHHPGDGDEEIVNLMTPREGPAEHPWEQTQGDRQ